MHNFFKSMSGCGCLYKHKDFPVYIADEFNFFRCVEFAPEFYGKTVSYLHAGNLRTCSGRYSSLFPGQKLSYWADSPKTAMTEIKKHGSGNNILTFWAYDDATSTFPTLPDKEPLIIIDGRKCGIQCLIDKVDDGIELTSVEQQYLLDMIACQPDCLVYDSRARKGGENFIFFEKGFRKLALRQLRLRFGRSYGGNHNIIVCADTSDYMPFIEQYGQYFAPKARIKMDESYLQSKEYLMRKKIYDKHHSF